MLFLSFLEPCQQGTNLYRFDDIWGWSRCNVL